jgi:undecaprenol kinase
LPIEETKPMKNRPFYVRMGFAWNGIRQCWKTESSFRIHCLIAILTIIALSVIRPDPLWWALAAMAVSLVMAFELINSAVERLIDHLHPEIHPEIGVIKDMASGGVLVVGIGALVIGICLAVTLL